MRSVIPSLVLYVGVFIACVALAAVPGCGVSQRQKTLRSAVLSVNVARDGFTAFDASHQKAIVEKATTREEGEAALAAYRLKRMPVVASFEVVYQGLAVAATQTDEPSLQAALAASAGLLAAIKSLTGGP